MSSIVSAVQQCLTCGCCLSPNEQLDLLDDLVLSRFSTKHKTNNRNDNQEQRSEREECIES